MNETKAQRTVQKISKWCKIIANICFIGCVIAIIFLAMALLMTDTVVGLLQQDAGAIFGEEYNGLTIAEIIESEAGVSIAGLEEAFSQEVKAILAGTLVTLIATAVLYRLAAKFFKDELKAGTPFTTECADRMKKLGIIHLCVAIGTSIVSSIVVSFMSTGAGSVDIEGISLIWGILWLILSAIFRLGAEQIGKKDDGFSTIDL